MLRKVVCVSASLTLCVGPSSAQPSLFAQLGAGVRPGALYSFVEDSLNDVLYLGGGPTHTGDGIISPGIFKWDGAQLHAMGCGFNWDCVSPLSNGGLGSGVVTMAFWNNELYAAGDLYSLNGAPLYNIARWDGNAWQGVGGGLNGLVVRLRPYPDGLYAVGYFDEAEGQEANGLARWDGTAWHSVFDLPVISPVSDLNLLADMAWYEGKLYIGGNFGGGAGTGLNDIACWDGNQWGPIGNGFLGVYSSVRVLEEHDGLLYVAGSFADYPPDGNQANPGTGILTWDGSNWAELGNGTRGAGSPSINYLTWINDTLYVSGTFDLIGDVPSGRLAKWDGTRWCSLVPPNYFTPGVVAPVGHYRDTLVVGGSFLVAGPDSIARVAKWTGGDYVDSCSIGVGQHEIHRSVDVAVFPNPASDQVTISTTTPIAVVVHDALARSMWSGMVFGREILDTSAWPIGMYTVRAGPNARKFIIAR